MSKRRLFAGVAAIAALCWGAAAQAALTGVFDLQWNGPETSTVEECPADGFCFTYAMRGGLQLDLDAETPRLINVQSDVLLPPCGIPFCPPAISPLLWGNLDLLHGTYVEPANEGDVSIVFAPEVGGHLRSGWELFVDITDGGRQLTVTGGIQQDAASPLEPDVVFSVSGRLLGDGEELTTFVPEPGAVTLAALGIAGLAAIASLRRR